MHESLSELFNFNLSDNNASLVATSARRDLSSLAEAGVVNILYLESLFTT